MLVWNAKKPWLVIIWKRLTRFYQSIDLKNCNWSCLFFVSGTNRAPAWQMSNVISENKVVIIHIIIMLGIWTLVLSLKSIAAFIWIQHSHQTEFVQKTGMQKGLVVWKSSDIIKYFALSSLWFSTPQINILPELQIVNQALLLNYYFIWIAAILLSDIHFLF